MSTARLVQAITLLAVFAMAARISMDTDTWWHLRAGEWILENRSIIQEDLFSYTRLGEAWQYPGWLVEVPMFLIYQGFGPGGLNLWTAVMVTIAFGFVWMTLSGGPFLRAFTVILAAAASGVYWAARPYLVTFVFAAVFLWILEEFRWRGKDRLFWLPILMVVWANSHGGFAVGLVLIGIYCLDLVLRIGARRIRDRRQPGLDVDRSSNATDEAPDRMRKLGKLALIGLISTAVIAINPSGPEMLLYPIKTISIGGLQDYIAEWQSPNFHELRVQPFLWLFLLSLAMVGFSRKRLAISDFLLVAVFASLGMMAARNIALFALAAPPVVTRHAAVVLAALRRQFFPGVNNPSTVSSSRLARGANILIFLVLLLAVSLKAMTVFPEEVNNDYFRKTYPMGAVAYLHSASPEGPLFNSYNWGGYLLWALPDYPVFIDGRTDLFDDEIIDDWIQAIRAEGDWEAILDLWGVKLALLEPGYPLAAQLRARGWRVLHEDSISILLGRP
jgi:hypothetical protein